MAPDLDPRDTIDEAIRASVTTGEGSVVTGWTLVVEMMGGDGQRWLARAHAETTPSWTARGMHFEALHGDWPDEDED